MKTIKVKIVLDDEKDYNRLLKAINEIKQDIPFIFEVEE